MLASRSRTTIFLVNLASQPIAVQAVADPQASASMVAHTPAAGAARGPIHLKKRRCHLSAQGIDWKVNQSVCNKHSH